MRVGVFVGVGVAVAVFVGVGVAVAVFVGVGVAVAVLVAVGVAVAVFVGDGVGRSTMMDSDCVLQATPPHATTLMVVVPSIVRTVLNDDPLPFPALPVPGEPPGAFHVQEVAGPLAVTLALQETLPPIRSEGGPQLRWMSIGSWGFTKTARLSLTQPAAPQASKVMDFGPSVAYDAWNEEPFPEDEGLAPEVSQVRLFVGPETAAEQETCWLTLTLDGVQKNIEMLGRARGVAVGGGVDFGVSPRVIGVSVGGPGVGVG